MRDKLMIKECIEKMLLAIDERKWEEAPKYFTEKVFCDYSSLSGVEGSIVNAKDMISGWRQLVPGFEGTQHFLSNVQVEINEEKAKTVAYVSGIHYLKTSKGTDTWTVNGFYEHELEKIDDEWKINAMTLKVSGILGNRDLPRMARDIVVARKENLPIRERVEFYVKGEKVVANLYRPADLEAGKKYPAAIVGGSWTTVKEMMAGTYAEKLGKEGLVALAIDHRGYGESDGEIRDFEDPSMKVQDFKGAISFMTSIDFVDSEKINLVGVCASAGYMSKVAYKDERVNSFVSVAGWLHKPETVELIYGGKEGVDKLLQLSNDAKKVYNSTEEVKYVVACSDTDSSAAMFGPFEYYLDENRGKIKEWGNRFALMAWEVWLTFNPIKTANLIKVPVFMIHSEEAALPQGAREFYESVEGDKYIFWTSGNQFDFYDNEEKINEAIEKIVTFLKNN